MPRYFIVRTAKILLAAPFLFLQILSVFANTSVWAQSEAAAPQAHVEEILGQIESAREQAKALDADAQSVSGDDALALRMNAIEIRLGVAADLSELVNEVTELEENGVDVTAYRDRLRVTLPAAAQASRQIFASIESDLKQLKLDFETASGSDRVELGRRVEVLDSLLERILFAAVDQISFLEGLDLPADEARGWLGIEIQKRARLNAARIQLWSARRTHADEASASAPDDAALAAAASEAGDRFEANISALAAAVSMLETLQLDSADYQVLVVESTGEISAQLLDSNLAGDLLARWTDSLTSAVVENGPGVLFKSLIFAALLTGFWWLSRVVQRVIERALDHSRVRISQLLKRTMVSLGSSSVFLAGLLIGLSQMGFEIGPMLAGLGIAGFVLGFALQDTLSNFASGVMILAYEPYDVGDLIECSGGVFGTVSQMNLVSTTILTLDNQTRVVPNGKIWGDVITNVTAQKVRRVDMVFGISYSDEIPKAEAVLSEILENHPKVLEEPESNVRVHELGDSSVNFIVRPWVNRLDYWDVFWDVTREVKMRFDYEGISIPFPQRDVHFYRESDPEINHPVESVRDEPKLFESELNAQDPPDDEEEG